jgi:ATP-dependent Clp protease ATP-binding subunit ClpA
VRRLVDASVEDFEQLLLDAGDGGVDFEGAAYPPGCDPPSGPLRFRALDAGGVVLEVERREIASDDFLLSVLFHSGSCVFPDADELARFWRGPVALAFGVSVDPLPVRPTEALAEDVGARAVARRPGNGPRAGGRATASRAPSRDDLEQRLSLEVRGQEAAVRRVADVVSCHLAKTVPARPESLMLAGPSGSGKTSTVRALPRALADLGWSGAHVFRVDCNELTDDYDVHRFLGAAPGLVGYRDEPPLVEALSKPRCIVLLDEFEKAHEAMHRVFLGLLDEGRVTTPCGDAVRAPDAIVALTTNLGVDELAYRLREAPPHDRWRERVCRDHLLRLGWPAELVGRIGAFVVFEPLESNAVRRIAEDAIRELGHEYGVELESLPEVIVDVVIELADVGDIGARALGYATRDLLGQSFAEAARQGLEGKASIDAGPPPAVVGRPCVP